MTQRNRLHRENIYNLMKNPVADWMTPIELPTDKPVGLYGRQSTLFQVQDNQASNDYQINEQRRILINRYGWNTKLIIEYFDDFAFSGTLGIGERVGITQLTEDIEADILKAVYVFLEDRLFRDRHLENVVKFARICFEHEIYIITSYRIYRMWLDGDKSDFIEACKRAWEQFDTQLNKRMMPMRAYKAHGGYYDSRGINIGYIVDKDKKSKTYNRYIIYEPHAEFIRWLYWRFIELSGSLALLAEELEKMPVHFEWLADNYFNKKCPLSKILGVGYRIGTWKTLKGILTNNVYIGVWKAGNDEYPGNHDAIIDIETWNAVQKLMEARTMKTQPVARKELSVLSGLIERPAPYWSVSIEPATSKKSSKAIAFRFRPKGIMSDEHTEEIHYSVVEETFRGALTGYVEEDQCIEYAKEAARLYDREEKNKKHIQETLSRLQARHQGIYNDVTDHTLDIPKQAKRQMYEEIADLETEIARLEAVLKRKKVTLDFSTIVELMRKIKKHWHDVPIDLLHEFAAIFTKSIRLKLLSPHLWEMRINWKIWGQDIYVIWQSSSSHLVWTKEEHDTLKRMVEAQSDIQEILNLLPRFSYDSIYTKCLDDFAHSPYPFHGYRLDSCLSIQDYDVLARYNIPMESIALLKNMTVIARDKEGNTYYRRAYDGRVKSQDGAFFIGHADIEELQGNSNVETL
ncbi:MAG TPA: recombinase family protein [Ktedonobacteraceae bacterium]|nr:recombinase family protein [Ktedonobacteraceae bacterium]